MELPLISPSTGGPIQPGQVVHPQNEAFQHIAEAGGRAQEAATNLYYLNRMALRDEQGAWLARARGQGQGAVETINGEIAQKNIDPQDIPAYFKQRFHELSQPILAQFPEGPTRDLVQGDLGGLGASAGPEMQTKAVARQIQDADANTHATLKMLADQYPFLEPHRQADIAATAASLIDSNNRWGPVGGPTKTLMHEQWKAQADFGSMQKFAGESPGHFLTESATPGYAEKNADTLKYVGGYQALQKLRTQALGQINQRDNMAKQGFRQAQTDAMDEINSYKMRGEVVPPAVVQRMADSGVVSGNVLKWANPTYHVQPPSDPARMNYFINERVPEIRDTADAQLLQGEIASSPTMNAKERAEAMAHVHAQVTNLNTAFGQAYKAGLEQIDATLNPPAKPGEFVESYERKGRAERVKAAREAYITEMYGQKDPAAAAAAAQRAIATYGPQPPPAPAAKTNPAATAAPVLMKTGESPAEYAARLKAAKLVP